MYEFLDYEAHDAMTRKTVTVHPRTSIAAAQALLDEHDFNGLPVVDDEGELVGMLTKLDLLAAFDFDQDDILPRYHEIMERPVSLVMTRDVRTVTPRARLERVLRKMVDTRCKSFPVVDSGRLVGIIAREDVLRALERAVSGERAGGFWAGEEA